jgi:hypothetical protein
MNHSVEETKASEWYKTKVYESKTGKSRTVITDNIDAKAHKFPE